MTNREMMLNRFFENVDRGLHLMYCASLFNHNDCDDCMFKNAEDDDCETACYEWLSQEYDGTLADEP